MKNWTIGSKRSDQWFGIKLAGNCKQCSAVIRTGADTVEHLHQHEGAMCTLSKFMNDAKLCVWEESS